MKKSFLIAPVGALAIGVAVLFLRSKTKAVKTCPAKADSKTAGTVTPKKLTSAAYSFASGYKDAKTVNVGFAYDSERFNYAVVSEDFIAETGDSHVGILRGEELAAQLEYAAHCSGEDFAALTAHVSQRYKGYGKISCNNIDGIRYYDGKSLCVALPIAGVSADYVLITVIPAGDSGEDDYLELWDNADFQALLNTMTITAE